MGRAHPTFHAPAFHYPEGYAYRRWGRGDRLPLLFLAPEYVFLNYAALDLDPPPYGYEWVRYGPDLLLVQLGTGQVVEVVPGAIY
jgi:Ni/Co efflux regulator RcnB